MMNKNGKEKLGGACWSLKKKEDEWWRLVNLDFYYNLFEG